MRTKQISIVGGGLAGCFLGLRLALAGHAVTLFDDARPESASRVAAGLFNVITGRFGTKSWKADQLLAEIRRFFEQPACRELQQHLHYVPIYRPFKNLQDYNKWVGKAVDQRYAPLCEFLEQGQDHERIHNELGGVVVLPCGWADTEGLLSGMRHLIRTLGGSVLPGNLAYEQVRVTEKTITHEGRHHTFDELVFCEGYRARTNPFFPDITIIPNKGDLLRIRAKTLRLSYVLSKKVFVIPLEKDEYLVGSTYENTPLDPLPSEKGKAEILGHLENAIKVPFEVIDHRAGIRPTTPNRRPIVGTHSSLPYVHVLNGLGTKGMLLAPYCSDLLSRRLSGEEVALPEEIQAARFRS